jgi:hypothetical protein
VPERNPANGAGGRRRTATARHLVVSPWRSEAAQASDLQATPDAPKKKVHDHFIYLEQQVQGNSHITDQNLVERTQTWVMTRFGDLVYEHRFTDCKDYNG